MRARDEVNVSYGIMSNPQLPGYLSFYYGYLGFGVICRFTHPIEVAKCIE